MLKIDRLKNPFTLSKNPTALVPFVSISGSLASRFAERLSNTLDIGLNIFNTLLVSSSIVPVTSFIFPKVRRSIIFKKVFTTVADMSLANLSGVKSASFKNLNGALIALTSDS